MIIKDIWRDKLSDYVIMDYVLKIWVTGLLFMFVLGVIAITHGIISGEADIQNATFGIFDTLGS